ncbi:hypothetical protein [Vibrio salinus]|uniref:hypothetical protein n=1 Tax=Vibrio salinus TaxID=2899784 RepID=UPI001E30C7CC|nr:hypothetical protein [Vibrio salinus]MCE0495937.1 hypothetical protein [Vibrio salinus]
MTGTAPQGQLILFQTEDGRVAVACRFEGGIMSKTQLSGNSGGFVWKANVSIIVFNQ